MACLAAGCIIVAVATMTDNVGIGVVLGLVWMVVGNLILMRLKCVRCGKMLITVPPMFYRFFGLHTCAHCGKKQPP
ncbi:MAG: hypothetical protein ACO1TE_00695 [Prosthecobacter sp.]